LNAREESIRASATGLDAVERELIAVHRSETAWLLRQICLNRLLDDETGPGIVNRYATSGNYTVADPDEIARRREELGDVRDLSPTRASLTTATSRQQQDAWMQDASRLVDEFVRAPRESSPSVLTLASLSLRLEPTNQGRLLAAIDLVQRGSPQTAIRLALDVLDSHPTNEHAARAWECIGSAHLTLESRDEALDAYRHATSQVEAPYLLLMNRLLVAAQLGLDGDVIDSSRRLEELVSVDHPVVACFVSCQRESRKRNVWSPSRQGIALRHRIGERTSQLAGRILNVLE
jgi:hypothetical protein